MVVPSGSLGSWETKTIVTNMFPLLVVLSIIVLWAGITLEDAEELLEQFGLLAVMVPTMVDMGGNLGAILSSRLSTRFHLGTTEIDLKDRVLWSNIAAILALGATIFTTLAVGAWAIGQAVSAIDAIALADLLLISLTSGMAVAVIAVVFSLLATYGSYKLGIDPDDTTIPIVTNVVDVCGMIIFIGISGLVLF